MDHRQIGFTLTELLIVMAIVAILAAIAYPLYSGAMAKERRASAKELMTRVAQLEARYFTENNGYTGSLTELGLPADPMTSESRGHAISISAFDGTSYTIAARPLVADSACGTLTITSTNVRSASGARPEQCW
jgi:type IV pilus assembly protein PilE